MPARAGLLAAAASILLLSHAGTAATPRGQAPAFRARTIAGADLQLAALLERGPVLVDFWATWCKPCVAAVPELQSLYRKYEARGFTIVGVSVDGPRNFAKVRPFITRLGITYPVVLDQDGSLQDKFQVSAMPTTILIDPSGAIARVQLGYRPGDSAALEKAIVALLAPAGDAAGAAPADSARHPDTTGSTP